MGSINIVTTILNMRAPGMTLMKMPVFVWSVLGSMMLVIAAFPILTATLGMLSLDRLLGMHFFTSELGGNAMMYVNLIWAWGHPEVYILVLPAFGAFSEIVATFSGKRLFGYASMVVALMCITLLSFTVWLHHFFTMGAGADVNTVFGITTMVIAIPTGVKIFNWLFTMYRGRIRFTAPMLWFLGFVTTFTIGGMTGVLLSVPAIDFQMHNSLFLVAHFHNMIIGGVLFGYFAALGYWFPKITGFRLHEGLGKIAFWCWLIGFLLAFMPLYALGIMGATRRMDHYDATMGWQWLFIIAAVGVATICAGVAFQVLQLLVSILQRNRRRDITGDAWGARTLEWSVSSPAPEYNFAIIPTVTTRDAWWETKKAQTTGKKPAKQPVYKSILVPKNTNVGMFIAGFAFLVGFGLIWHMWWLAIAGLLGIIATLIVRSLDEETERVIPASEIAELEAKFAAARLAGSNS
jgi:cytochrome o ubiquinol oxidase subunit 1